MQAMEVAPVMWVAPGELQESIRWAALEHPFLLLPSAVNAQV